VSQFRLIDDAPPASLDTQKRASIQSKRVKRTAALRVLADAHREEESVRLDAASRSIGVRETAAMRAAGGR